MSRMAFWIVAVAFLGQIHALTGCSLPATDSKSDIPHENVTAGNEGPSDMELMKIELARLSPKDAESAQQQHICPVSGKMLGTMGAPIKVDVEGRTVWICCESCREALLSNHDEYLEQLTKE